MHARSPLALHLRRLPPGLTGDPVQGAACLQPLQLIDTHRVLGRDYQLLARRLLDEQLNLTGSVAEKRIETRGRHRITGRDLRVVGLVSQDKRENTLFLQLVSDVHHRTTARTFKLVSWIRAKLLARIMAHP